ncbi:carboxy-S-adenosyl-L-methionine synthase CmoA [Arcticibacter sp. MXS-1]|uniref:carboxy-S-adenosyl-L-methionine synthase CmoA n=1 Tax=Arcticibacter sp. MXS-1 TaxID=3341726 RepID=UPI0035A830E2
MLPNSEPINSNLPDEQRDKVFSEEITKVSDFKFGAKVAGVFDDMVSRSVPFYGEMQRMISEIAADHAQKRTNVYDLGCSTGTTMIGMNTTVDNDIRFVGIDESSQMLEKCDEKLKEAGFTRPYELVAENMHEGFKVENASVVVLCLTLQFIRPIAREKVLKTIVEGLVPGGVLILVEKILAEESLFNRNFIKYYYEMKRRNHYSEMEIAQKREALENVLIPYKLSENILMLRESGFSHCEVFFKWYNFSGVVAIKN